jgi:AcrR family transcriptional regulator
MPYPPEHKAQTRARIVASARVLFNRHGFEQVSIDEIMQHAGLTRGGFYHHFDSKQALYSEAVRSFATCNPLSREAQKRNVRAPRELARLLVNLYLADEILENVDDQCPLIALPSDVARAGLSPQEAYTEMMQRMLSVFRAALTGSASEGDRKANLLLSLCVGGMVLARTTNDMGLQKSLRAAARSEALRILDSAQTEPARRKPGQT